MLWSFPCPPSVCLLCLVGCWAVPACPAHVSPVSRRAFSPSSLTVPDIHPVRPGSCFPFSVLPAPWEVVWNRLQHSDSPARVSQASRSPSAPASHLTRKLLWDVPVYRWGQAGSLSTHPGLLKSTHFSIQRALFKSAGVLFFAIYWACWLNYTW